VRDRTVYNEVELLRRRVDYPAVSDAALEIHVRAVDNSARTRRPEYVSDVALDALASGHITTLAALELTLARLWRRTTDGYVVCDLELIDHLSTGEAQRASLRWIRSAGAALARCWRVLNSETVIPL
jgi:hypothetical protein